MTETEQKEKMNYLMNKISLELKDATLQQGFEIICKRISELEKENEELEKIRSEQVKIMESDLTRIEQLKRRIDFLGIRIKSLKSQIKSFGNDFDYQNKVINKYKEDLKKLRCAYIQAQVANVISGTDFESILKSVLNSWCENERCKCQK